MTRTAAIGLGLALALAAPPRAIAQGTSGWILWEKSMTTKSGAGKQLPLLPRRLRSAATAQGPV